MQVAVSPILTSLPFLLIRLSLSPLPRFANAHSRPTPFHRPIPRSHLLECCGETETPSASSMKYRCWGISREGREGCASKARCRRRDETETSMLRCISNERGYVTDPPVTLARKVGPGLQDLQTRAQRILSDRNAKKAEENTWIGRMVAAEGIEELDGLIKSRAA